MKISNTLELSNNKKWLTNIYNRQICSKNFGYKSHLIDFIFYMNNQNMKLPVSDGDRDVKANL